MSLDRVMDEPPSSKAVKVSEESISSPAHGFLKTFPWETHVKVPFLFVTTVGLPHSPLRQTHYELTTALSPDPGFQKKKSRHKDERLFLQGVPLCSHLGAGRLSEGPCVRCPGTAFVALPKSEKDSGHICRTRLGVAWDPRNLFPSE